MKTAKNRFTRDLNPDREVYLHVNIREFQKKQYLAYIKWYSEV